MSDIYYEKYLKYKLKYINLVNKKKLLGGTIQDPLDPPRQSTDARSPIELKRDFILLIDQNLKKNEAIPKINPTYLRLATYNIHYFTDVSDTKNTYDNILSDIQNIDADVIILQEILIGGNDIIINPSITLNLSNLYSDLTSIGYKKKIFCNSTMSWYQAAYGNMMLINDRISTKCVSKLCNELDELNYTFDKAVTTTTVSGSHQGTAETRCYIYINIINNGITYHIIGTHLDVASETTRLEQITKIITKYNSLRDVPNNIIIIMGDFNTFNMEDYKQTEFETSEYTRENGLVYNYLKGLGYLDLTSTSTPLVTAWGMTRVDLIFSSHSVNFDPHIYYTKASDHLPVIVDIKS